MKAGKKGNTTTEKAKSDESDNKIMCSMTDDQYHEVINQLYAIEGMIDLVRPHADDTDLAMLIGLRVLAEKTTAAQALMQLAWDRTTEARAAA